METFNFRFAQEDYVIGVDAQNTFIEIAKTGYKEFYQLKYFTIDFIAGKIIILMIKTTTVGDDTVIDDDIRVEYEITGIRPIPTYASWYQTPLLVTNYSTIAKFAINGFLYRTKQIFCFSSNFSFQRPIEATVTLQNDNDLVVTVLEGGGNYRYRINNGIYQNSNVFETLPTGVYAVEVKSYNDLYETEPIEIIIS